ncbi:MAG: hemerythrin domain-containing protein [Alysiella sp.]|uniref:hemerythrin domain-containing protein n=1 Tax=Alysiella sp. TaxID=1872483 RepID=UPI0026DA9916|nr:hemerythrin domain-containing protein [Alysiella sp.]MDO4433845.1 hemerythrin domain-containing protein [Alysiella sp.]
MKPLKRHFALVKLSQEHHHTLALCLRILRAPTLNHAADIQNHFVDLEKHFQDEENQFAPLWAKLQRDDLRLRFENEHTRLRALYHDAEFDNANWNTTFATLLREHARFEERELFPAIQTILPAAE